MDTSYEVVVSQVACSLVPYILTSLICRERERERERERDNKSLLCNITLAHPFQIFNMPIL